MKLCEDFKGTFSKMNKPSSQTERYVHAKQKFCGDSKKKVYILGRGNMRTEILER